jgi:DNA-binding NarL/FixJ family response regulator
VNIGDPNNGQSLSQPDRAKPKRHNAKHCPFAIRERIVNALANGDSKRAIARALRVSNNTVTAVAEQEWQQVESRKARIAAQAEQAATRAVDRINNKLNSSDDIPLSTGPRVRRRRR